MRPIAFITTLLSALLLPTALARAAGTWTWPVRGQVVTQYRNGDDPYAAAQHRGIDIAAPVGAPVAAATSGTIQYAGVVGSSGLTVSERTADGRYALSYLHLSALAVRRGDHVAAGALLGAVGISGRRSTEQPHLHFGVRLASDRHAYFDPLSFLAPLPTDGGQPRPAPVPVTARVPARPEPGIAPLPVPSAVPVGAAAPAVLGSAIPALAPAAAGAAPHARDVSGRSASAAPSGGRLPVPSHAGAPNPGGARATATPQGAQAATAAPHGAGAASTAPQTGGSKLHAGARTGHTSAPAADARPRGAARARRSAVAQASSAAAPHQPAQGPPSGRPARPAEAHLQAMRPAARPHKGGVDAGWLAACIGLIAAAALLGRSAGVHRRSGSARAVFGALVRAGSRG
jgi:hypothetical protein